MAEKVTIMKLKVDLECEKCYKKVKKLLSKYPQIRDQKFEEKQNIVIITVVCCSPEKIRDKLCCKGGGSIKSIEIVETSKPIPPEPVKKEVKFAEPEKKKDPEKKKEDDKPKTKPKPTEPEKKQEPEKKKEAEKPKSDAPKKDPEKTKEKPAEPKSATSPAPMAMIFDPVPAYPQVLPPMAVPVGIHYVPAYEGRPVGPYVNEYAGPPLGYDGYYGRPVYDSYGGGRPYYASRGDQYFSEENAQGCTIM